MSRRVLAVVLASAMLIALGFVFVFRSSPPRPTLGWSSSQQAASHPAVPDEKEVFAGYGGSESCRSCHEDEFADWKTSNHALAERPVSADIDGQAFQPAQTFTHGTQHTETRLTNGDFQLVALGIGKSYQAYTAERVIGRDPLRQFLIPFLGGRYQVTEAAYDPRSNDWFNVYGNENRQPGEWGHWTGRGMNWNSMCAGCHNTRLRKNYDASSDVYHTTMAEASVGCEACHGPLKAHNEWQGKFGKSGKHDPTLVKLTREQAVDNCGFCHARRGELTGDFQPGDKFDDDMRLTTVDATDTFYPDGQIRDEDYEYAAFLGSRMHLKGVACMDCHNPHTAKTVLPGNWLCMKCHNGSYTNAPVIDPVSHSHHKVFGYDASGVLTNTDLVAYRASLAEQKSLRESGGECVNCHMPQTVYMQRHWRHDHGFTIPDPLLTKQYQVPNACNRCHQDKDAAWALKYCENWYGAKMDRPGRRRAVAIAQARIGDRSALDSLLGLVANEEIPYWRAVEVGMMKPWLDDNRVRDIMVRAVSDSNSLVRAECIRALEPLAAAGDTNAFVIITSHLDDKSRSVRLAAAWALRGSPHEPSAFASASGPPGEGSASASASSSLVLGQGHSVHGPNVELARLLDLTSDQPLGQMQEGAFLLASGHPQEAAMHYQKAITWDPNSAPIRHDYAVALSSLNRNREAVEQLEAACSLEPGDAEYRYKLGLAWNEAGDSPKALESLEAAVRLDPRHARAQYNLGLALNSAGRTEEALAALSRAESADAADPRIPYARATILARLGRLPEARNAARRALEIQPAFAPAAELLNSL